MKSAWFITNEDGDDLIVSFAIPTDDAGNVKVSRSFEHQNMNSLWRNMSEV